MNARGAHADAAADDDALRASYAGTAVCVLGASGFVGRWVARELARLGARVVAGALDADAARDALRSVGARAQVEVVDVARAGVLAPLLQRTRPAVVFNAVGYGVDRSERDPDTAQRVNAELPGELAKAVADARESARADAWPGTALVHVGSALEYGEIGGDLSEESVPDATTLYGRTKLAGTRRLAEVAARRSLPALTARLFTVYGPGEHEGRLLPSLLAARDGGDDLPLTAGEQRRDFTWIGDVAAGLARLGARPCEPGWVVNLATGRSTRVREFVEAAALELGIAPERLRFGTLPTRAEEMQHDPVNVGRLRACLGWTPATPVPAGVRLTRDFVADTD